MIAILAPYNHGEETVAAIRLADLCISMGLDVRFIALRPISTNVHIFWDSRVIHNTGDNLYRAAAGANVCVWFGLDLTTKKKVELVAPASEHVLVPRWQDLNKEYAPVLATYTLIVAPTMAACSVLRERVFEGQHDEKTVTWARWDSGITPQKRKAMASKDGKLRIFAYCDSGCIDEFPLTMVFVIGHILSTMPNTIISVWSTKSWPLNHRRTLSKLSKRYINRLNLLGPASLDDELTLMHRSDWSLMLTARGEFGIHAMRSLSCGVPVIALDNCPYNELLIPDFNSSLIPCEIVHNGWNKAPLAAPHTSVLTTSLINILRDQKYLNSLYAQEWKLEGSQKACIEFWSSVFDVDHG